MGTKILIKKKRSILRFSIAWYIEFNQGLNVFPFLDLWSWTWIREAGTGILPGLPAVLCAVYNSLDDEPYNVLKIPPYGCHDIFCPGKYADARGGWPVLGAIECCPTLVACTGGTAEVCMIGGDSMRPPNPRRCIGSSLFWRYLGSSGGSLQNQQID